MRSMKEQRKNTLIGISVILVCVFFVKLLLAGFVIAFVACVAPFAIGFIGAAAPWIPIMGGSVISSAPPKPEVEYGEFPFTLVYEIDGDTKTVKDTLVIEYKGVDWNEARGKYIVWNRYFKSRPEEYNTKVVILFDGGMDANDPCVYLELGSCEYYMGLEEDPWWYYYPDTEPGDIVFIYNQHPRDFNADEFFEYYGVNIKIIKKEISPPIGPKE